MKHRICKGHVDSCRSLRTVEAGLTSLPNCDPIRNGSTSAYVFSWTGLWSFRRRTMVRLAHGTCYLNLLTKIQISQYFSPKGITFDTFSSIFQLMVHFIQNWMLRFLRIVCIQYYIESSIFYNTCNYINFVKFHSVSRLSMTYIY